MNDPLIQFLLVIAGGGLLMFGILTLVDDENSGKLHRAQHEAQKLCLEQYGARTFDVQDEYKMVYACRKDGKLHVINYENY